MMPEIVLPQEPRLLINGGGLGKHRAPSSIVVVSDSHSRIDIALRAKKKKTSPPRRAGWLVQLWSSLAE